MTMISDEQIYGWLSDNCRNVKAGWIWPKGTLHSDDTSFKIVKTYKNLGIEPSETVSIDLVLVLLQRIAVPAVVPGPVLGRRCPGCGHDDHDARPGDPCGAAVLTAEGRECSCTFLPRYLKER